MFFNAEGSVFKPVIIHDENLDSDIVQALQRSVSFKYSSNGMLDKASLDFVLDCVVKYVVK